MQAGIEAINAYCGSAYIEVKDLAVAKGLDPARLERLLIKQKAVALPHEDAISNAINAAHPLVQSLPGEDREAINLLIVCSESGVDFSKSMSTYAHSYLGLSKHCRMFEIKQACYSGVAGMQMAVNHILSQTTLGSKALVIASDITRGLPPQENQQTADEDWSYGEPTGGTGAVAVLVSDKPSVFTIDQGASGFFGYEVMDTCRPDIEMESGNADMSLMSYLECCAGAFENYSSKLTNIDFQSTFDLLAFHTPFGGMVKGAHRQMMRRLAKSDSETIELDFEQRVAPSLEFASRVGNIMGASMLLSLLSTIYNSNVQDVKRIGCFSYGSGCCSEFFSGVSGPNAGANISRFDISADLDQRKRLDMQQYNAITSSKTAPIFGTRNLSVDDHAYRDYWQGGTEKKRLFLKKIDNYHREYHWL